jgi:hypothetical protein
MRNKQHGPEVICGRLSALPSISKGLTGCACFSVENSGRGTDRVDKHTHIIMRAHKAWHAAMLGRWGCKMHYTACMQLTHVPMCACC